MPFSGNIHLTWNANTEPDLAGYKMYGGTSTANYNLSGSPIDVGNVTSGTFPVPGPGQYFFAVTAYDTSSNESDFSAEVSRRFFFCGNFPNNS